MSAYPQPDRLKPDPRPGPAHRRGAARTRLRQGRDRRAAREGRGLATFQRNYSMSSRRKPGPTFQAARNAEPWVPACAGMTRVAGHGVMIRPRRHTLYRAAVRTGEQAPAALAVISGGRTTTYAELATAVARVAGGMRGAGRAPRRPRRHPHREPPRVAGGGVRRRRARRDRGAVQHLVETGRARLSDRRCRARPAGRGRRVRRPGFRRRARRIGARGGSAPPGEWRSGVSTSASIAVLDAPPRRGWIAYADLRRRPQRSADDAAPPDDDALILYTSGSSARPKAVRLHARRDRSRTASTSASGWG